MSTEVPNSLDLGKDVREIGHLAVWSVTSAKPGNGVELLRDDNKDTYWQSDGTQPHLVDIQFQKKMHVQVCEVPGVCIDPAWQSRSYIADDVADWQRAHNYLAFQYAKARVRQSPDVILHLGALSHHSWHNQPHSW